MIKMCLTQLLTIRIGRKRPRPWRSIHYFQETQDSSYVILVKLNMPIINHFIHPLYVYTIILFLSLILVLVFYYILFVMLSFPIISDFYVNNCCKNKLYQILLTCVVYMFKMTSKTPYFKELCKGNFFDILLKINMLSENNSVYTILDSYVYNDIYLKIRLP